MKKWTIVLNGFPPVSHSTDENLYEIWQKRLGGFVPLTLMDGDKIVMLINPAQIVLVSDQMGQSNILRDPTIAPH